MKLLTNEEVANKRGRQAEDNDQDVGDGEIHNEVVGNGAHARGAQHDGNDEAVADQAHQKDKDIGDTVDNGHGQRVAVEWIEAEVPVPVELFPAQHTVIVRSGGGGRDEARRGRRHVQQVGVVCG